MVLVALLVLSAVPASGSTITVTNTNDSGPGSLRDAIAVAADGDTIDFGLSLPNTISISSPLVIDSSQSRTLTINGPGALSLAINGGDSVAVFVVQPLGGSGGPVTVTISDLTIEHGSSFLGGGLFNGGTLSLVRCVVRDNSVGTRFGGGIFNAARLTVTSSIVTGNSAGNDGLGGGIYNAVSGTLSLLNSAVSNNSAGAPGAPGEGGGIHNDRGGLTLTGTTVSGNTSNHGAGISNDHGTLVALRSRISSNVTGDFGTGGGVANDAGEVTLTESTVADNAAGNFGAGIYSNGGRLTVIRSTISGNSARTPIAGAARPLGGGIFAASGILTMTNSTVANNHAQHKGGGIFGFGGGGAITSSTISGNTTQESGGGGVAADDEFSAGFTFANTIVADNTSHNCSYLQNHDLSTLSLGYNLSNDFTCPFLRPQDLNAMPAGLDPAGLKNNGGPTQTIGLQATSAAVNAIPVSRCIDASGAPVATDQRGVPRPQGPGCDVGAYELFRSRFVTEVVQTFELINAVRSSPLPPGPQQGLVAPLQGAVDSLGRGAVTPAVNQLGAFIREADALTATGALTSELGDALTTGAHAIVDSLNGG